MKPSRAPWPCSTCGLPGVKNLGTNGFCAAHLAAFYREHISPGMWMWAGGGIGLPVLERRDHGPGWWELECSACAAGWVGPAFERCPWCAGSIERMQADQANELLHPTPLAGDLVRTWVARLGRAVESGLITVAEARRAVARVAPKEADCA